MPNPNLKTLYFRRIIIIVAVCTIAIFMINESAFYLVNKEQDRAPMTIELTIPAGTAEKVAQGEEVASIPAEMIFIVGDVLLISNYDTAGHELGPVFVPPNTSASMKLDEADKFAMSCSFRPSKYFGLTIKAPTDFTTRLEGLLFSVPATSIVAFLYSLAIRPIALKEDEQEIIASEKIE